MSRYRAVLVLLVAVFASSRVTAGEIVVGMLPGSVLLRDNGREIVYRNVVGDNDGFDRSLININGSPALSVKARYEYYYTLEIRKDQVLIDCAYFDVRNVYNGARASAGMCGLNIELSEDYYQIAQRYANEWRSSIFSFDTRDVLELEVKRDFLLGRIGGVEIFDRYSSAYSLINSLPQKIIKSDSGCFDFGNAIGFLVFLKQSGPNPKYLDVLDSDEPKIFRRMHEEDLKKIAVGQCDFEHSRKKSKNK